MDFLTLHNDFIEDAFEGVTEVKDSGANGDDLKMINILFL